MTCRALLAGAGLALLVACSKTPPAESVEALVADPARLAQLRAACKADRANVGDLLCNRVADATGRVFLGRHAGHAGIPPGPSPDAK